MIDSRSTMIVLGFTFLLIGAALVVAEAHVPAGAFGVAAGLVLMAGGIIVMTALGGGVLLAVPVAAGVGAVAGGWVYVTRRAAGSWRGAAVRAGAEALCGRVGVVRRWGEHGGHVFVDGALWRARDDWSEEHGTLQEGDSVVVQRIHGLTLSVRRAEEWELIP
jgi:membrane-bound serine protease (ClpP class)